MWDLTVSHCYIIPHEMAIFFLTLTRQRRSADQPEQHSEEIEGPDLEFALSHAALHRFFADHTPLRRALIEVLYVLI